MKKAQLLILGLFLAKPAIASETQLVQAGAHLAERAAIVALETTFRNIITVYRLAQQVPQIARTAHEFVIPEHITLRNHAARLIGVLAFTVLMFSFGFVFEHYSSASQFAYTFNDPALTISALNKAGSIGFGGFLLACILANAGVFDRENNA
jgi:hypothetical protein